MKVREILICEADVTRSYLEDFDDRRAIFCKYSSMRFKGQKERFYQKNKRIIDDCIIVERFMREHPELVSLTDIVVQRGKWKKENDGADAKNKQVQKVADQCKSIVRWVNDVLPAEEKIVYKPAMKTRKKNILPEIDTVKGEKSSARDNIQHIQFPNKQSRKQEMRNHNEKTENQRK